MHRPPAQDAVLVDLMRSSFDWKRTRVKGMQRVPGLRFSSAAPSRPLAGEPGPFGGRGGARTIGKAMQEEE